MRRLSFVLVLTFGVAFFTSACFPDSTVAPQHRLNSCEGEQASLSPTPSVDAKVDRIQPPPTALFDEECICEGGPEAQLVPRVAIRSAVAPPGAPLYDSGEIEDPQEMSCEDFLDEYELGGCPIEFMLLRGGFQGSPFLGFGNKALGQSPNPFAKTKYAVWAETPTHSFIRGYVYVSPGECFLMMATGVSNLSDWDLSWAY